MGPTGKSRVLQVHPTRRCNLRCLHCYSSSSPEERGEIAPALLRTLFEGARDEGYTVIGFSGGEPLLYGPLYEMLDEAKSLGLFTTVTSNGMLLDARRLDRLAGRLGLLAISLDGTPESHDTMRDDAAAFSTMAKRLEGVRESGIPFGFIFTLTQYNLNELPWIASFALSQGAKLLQIHPLEMAGRAEERMADARPDETEASWAYVAAAQLQLAVGDRMKVQLDLFNREAVAERPERVFGGDHCGPNKPLGELLSPLILEPDGTLVPVQYGFARHFALGNLHDEGFRLADCAARWRRELEGPFRALCRDELDSIVQSEGLPMTNWFERIGRRALERYPEGLVSLSA